MTRKDYEVIATAMVGQINNGFVKQKDIKLFIGAMANRLQMDNHKFDSEAFKNYIIGRI